MVSELAAAAVTALKSVPYDDHYDLLRSLWTAVLLHLVFTVALQIFFVVADSLASLRHFYHGIEIEAQPILAHEGMRHQRGSWSESLERASLTTAKTFMIFLAAAIFLSIPVAYKCNLLDKDTTLSTPLSALAGSVAGRCATCMSNAITGQTVALSWTYLGVSAIWGLLDVFSVGAFMHAMLSSILAVVNYALAVSLFVMGFNEWSRIISREC
ncbi:hypothetical protein BC829DRAFT_407631 [Chytridium lagenaria]|nr:hypothetical protein BC829DRAFT_407631 [Chytridium lagenaria]